MDRTPTSHVPSPDVHPELQNALAKAAELAATSAAPEPGLAGIRRSADLARKYWNEGGPVLEQCTPLPIETDAGEVAVVMYRARVDTHLAPVFVYLHGGGFRTGSAWTNDRQMREIAQAWGGIVISADYPHAPEHPFPAAVNRTASLLRALHARGSEWAINGDRIAIGGCSAGASVGFGAAIQLGGVDWLRAAVGIVGAFSGDTHTRSMQRFGSVGLFPDLASVPPMFDAYLPREADRADSRADLLHADPRLLPPTFLAAAEFDVFLDASAHLARRLAPAGRLHAFKVYPRMTHLFFGFSRSVSGAAECVKDIGRFLHERLPVVPPTPESVSHHQPGDSQEPRGRFAT